jgi:hypothetical protein
VYLFERSILLFKVAITPTSGEMFQFAFYSENFLGLEKVCHGIIKSGEMITKCGNKKTNIKNNNKNYNEK